MQRPLLKAALIAWGLSVTGLGVMLLARHELALPAPGKDDPVLAASLAKTAPGERPAFRAIHFLYGPCRCSQQLVDHLVERGPIAPFVESVVIASDDGTYSERLRRAGFTVTRVSPNELRDVYRIEAAPMMVALAPSGEVLYAGGYTSAKQSAAVADREILDDALHRKEHEALPVAGCGVSQRLRTFLNPGEIL